MSERTFKTKTGKVFVLRRISGTLYRALMVQWDKQKPKAPEVEVEINGHLRKERNYSDPDYLHEVNVWTQEKDLSISQYVFGAGIANNPADDDPDFTELHKRLFPDITDDEMRYHWASAQLGDPEETEALLTALVSQTEPTEQGVTQAGERFQGDSERGRRDAVATPAPEGEKAPANGQYLNPVAT